MARKEGNRDSAERRFSGREGRAGRRCHSIDLGRRNLARMRQHKIRNWLREG